MKHFKPFILLLTSLWLFNVQPAKATVFCAANSVALEVILGAIEDSGGSHEVRLSPGIYEMPAGGIFVNLFNDTDIDISGGWSEFFGNPCGQQLTGNAFNTILDGQELNRILRIFTRTNSDIHISNLYFASGFVTGVGERGGGLNITGLEGYVGKVVVENNVFINNQSKFAGALHISRGYRIDVRNNLFAFNHTESGAAVDIVAADQFGVYFNNNTVYGNTSDAIQPTSAGGLYLSVNESSGLIANNIFWDNDLYDIRVGSGYTYLKNNSLETYSGTFDEIEMNITAEPEFEPGFAGYIPVYNSPLVNAGTQPFAITPAPFEHGWKVGTKDVYGNTRIQHDQIDIGAVETSHGDLIFIDGFE